MITSTAVSGPAAGTAALGPITVQRQDPFGNPAAPGSAVTVNLTSSSTGATFAASPGGTATTTVVIPALASSTSFYYGDTKAGSPTITAGGTLAGATQGATIIAGTAAKLAFAQQPTNTEKSATITPAVTVQIQDAFGNRTTSGASVSIAIGVNGGTLLLGLGEGDLNGTQTVSGVLGLATFNALRIDGGLLNVGGEGNGYTLVVASTGLTPATSSPFNIT